MIGRITGQQIHAGAQQSIAAAKARLATLQQQASSGLAIAKPSDDPSAAVASMRIRSDLAANTQYATNIGDSLAWLATTDRALARSEDLVRQASDLMIQAGNPSLTPTAREAIAVQLAGVRDDLLAQANTKYLGRSVFAGTSDAAAAFAADGTPADTTGAPVQRRIGPAETVSVSADGAAAFGAPGTGTPGTSVLARIDRVVTALRDPAYDSDASATGPRAAVTAGIDAMGDSMRRLTAQHAVVGSNYSRIETAKSQNAVTSTALQQQRSGVEDVDTAQVLLELKTQELAYQTALAVTARVLQPTLMSFLQ